MVPKMSFKFMFRHTNVVFVVYTFCGYNCLVSNIRSETYPVNWEWSMLRQLHSLDDCVVFGFKILAYFACRYN